MDPTSVIMLALLVSAVFVRGPFLLYLMFFVQSFGSMAAVPSALVGGITLTPGWIAAALLAFQTFVVRRQGGQAIASLRDWRQTGLLFMCSIYGLVSAFLFPRLFANVVDVVPMRVMFRSAMPLVPTSSNITQAVYFIVITAIVVTMQVLAQTPKGRRQIIVGMIWGGVAAISTGLLDMAAAAAGAGAALAPFRNAAYALLVDVEFGSTRRVVGLMTEASAYAGLCISFACGLLFLRSYLSGDKKLALASWLLPALLLVMVALSTSSAGYVGMAVTIMIAIAHGLREVRRSGMGGLAPLMVVYVGVIGLLFALVFFPEVLRGPMDLIDQVVLQKSKSDSFAERSFWNTQALSAFLGTYGLGAGLGSVRASSWPMAILGNIGLPGALLMGAYLLRQFFSRSHGGPAMQRLLTGAKFAMIPLLVVNSLVGTSVNFNFMTATLLGLIAAASQPSAVPGSRATGARRRSGASVPSAAESIRV